MSFRKILEILALDLDSETHTPALQVSTAAKVQFKSAWAALTKVREAIAAGKDAATAVGRMQRSELGVHHNVTDKYLDWYAAARAWKDAHKELSLDEKMRHLVATTMDHPSGSSMTGYWQGRHGSQPADDRREVQKP